jgi:hypothetical protein
MASKIQISTLLLTAAMLWGILLFLDGVAISIFWLKPLSMVSGLMVFLLGVFDRWAWRIPFLYPWFVSTPNLRGTWKGQINSSWRDPSSGKMILPIDAYLVIEQTFSSLQVRLFTKESQSNLLMGNIFQNDGGTYSVAGIYRNTPGILNRTNSPMHYGSILLHMQGEKDFSLNGEYWTDRQTKGELHFINKSKVLAYDFEQASAL